MSDSEHDLMRQVRLALGARGDCVFWRNNVGRCVTQDGRRIQYGLAVGSADLVGCVNGQFVALELKGGKGRISEHQEVWGKSVQRYGGIYRVCNSVQTVVETVELAHVR